MVIESPEDVDKLVEELDEAGTLDTPGTEDGVIQLHEILGICGADPEDHRSYRAVAAVASVLSSYPPLFWGPVMDELCRVSMRALRDLRNRGGS